MTHEQLSPSAVQAQSSVRDLDTPLPGASFGQAVQRFWRGYVNFTGRASRREFLWAELFMSVVGFALGFGIGSSLFASTDATSPGVTAYYVFGILFILFLLGTQLPHLALWARRLADTGSSPLLVLLVLVPAGSLVVLILCCRSSATPQPWRRLATAP